MAAVNLVVKYAGLSNPLPVPIAVLIAPLYSNAAGTIPIAQALVGQGMPIGTVPAFFGILRTNKTRNPSAEPHA